MLDLIERCSRSARTARSPVLYLGNKTSLPNVHHLEAGRADCERAERLGSSLVAGGSPARATDCAPGHYTAAKLRACAVHAGASASAAGTSSGVATTCHIRRWRASMKRGRMPTTRPPLLSAPSASAPMEPAALPP